MRYTVISKRGTKLRNLNRRRAIRHHCLMCSDFQWPDVVRCENSRCPLHAFRLGRPEDGRLTPRDRAEAIAHFCRGCTGDNPAKKDRCDAVECSLYPYRRSHDVAQNRS